MKISFHSHANETNFHMKRWEPGLALKKRPKVIRKWPGVRFSKVRRNFQARKAIRKTTTCLFCKAGLLICCKGNKNKNNCEVSCLKTPSFWRYKENYVTRNTPEKSRDFRETGPRSDEGLRYLYGGNFIFIINLFDTHIRGTIVSLKTNLSFA